MSVARPRRLLSAFSAHPSERCHSLRTRLFADAIYEGSRSQRPWRLASEALSQLPMRHFVRLRDSSGKDFGISGEHPFLGELCGNPVPILAAKHVARRTIPQQALDGG